MRKLLLLAVVVALAGVAFTATQGGSSSHTANVQATYFPPLKTGGKGQGFVNRRTPGGDSGSVQTAAVIFTTDAKGIHAKLKPGAEIVESAVSYTKEFIPTHEYPEWDGKGALPLAKTIPTSSGGHRQVKVQEIRLMVYDPRFPNSEGYAYSLEKEREEEIRLDKEWDERQREYKEWEREEELQEELEKSSQT